MLKKITNFIKRLNLKLNKHSKKMEEKLLDIQTIAEDEKNKFKDLEEFLSK